MVPFKPYFLGEETPQWIRATSVQKCVRTGDIEEVGKTSRHGTFFQMNGNFAFGDYFKEGAITLAWDLITTPQAQGGYGLDADLIWPTGLRRRRRGVRDLARRDRRARGADHPPGWPTTSGRWACPARRPVHGDLLRPRPGLRPRGRPGRRRGPLPGVLEPRVHAGRAPAVRGKDDFEILGELPEAQHRHRHGPRADGDPAAGRDNLYEIDEVFPVLERAAELSGKRTASSGHMVSESHPDDVRLRVVADHVRSSLMVIADGVTPANEGRGYVLRRLLRRVVRSVRLLGYDDASLPELLPVSRERMKQSYPEVAERLRRIIQMRTRRRRRSGAPSLRAAPSSTPRSGDQAVRRDDTRGRPGVPVARHVRVPDRPDPGNGRRAGPRRRRGRVQPADGRAAPAGEGRREVRKESRPRGHGGVPGPAVVGATDFLAHSGAQERGDGARPRPRRRAGRRDRARRAGRGRARRDAVLRGVRRPGSPTRARSPPTAWS